MMRMKDVKYIELDIIIKQLEIFNPIVEKTNIKFYK
jgi:hypothetical protein